jgi:hypothetical protein
MASRRPTAGTYGGGPLTSAKTRKKGRNKRANGSGSFPNSPGSYGWHQRRRRKLGVADQRWWAEIERQRNEACAFGARAGEKEARAGVRAPVPRGKEGCQRMRPGRPWRPRREPRVVSPRWTRPR